MKKHEFGAETAPITKILPFSSVDGPGNRAVVFFQGCDFTCGYCHNPETQRICINCKECLSVCGSNSLFVINGKVSWNPGKCIQCDRCTDICKNNSSPKVLSMTVDDVIYQFIEAMPFISGITTSGGECTKYSQFLCELFEKTKSFGKNTLVDTNGQNLFSQIPRLLDVTDFVALDIKTIDSKEHMQLTGKSIDVVIENFEFLGNSNKLYEVRTVIVPDRLNASKTVQEVSKLLKRYPNVKYKLISFSKYGVRGEWENSTSPDRKFMENLRAIAQEYCKNDIDLVL